MSALPAVIEEHIGEVRALCEKYRVKRLAVFGSAVKGTFDPERSDLDFVVEFRDDVEGVGGWDAYFDLKFSLRDLFHRDVDLVELRAVRNALLREEVEASQYDIYDAA